MTLLRWLSVGCFGLAAFWVVHAAINLGTEDPYFKFSVAIFAFPPTLVGLLLLSRSRPPQILAGSLALIPAVLYSIFFVANMQALPGEPYDFWALLLNEAPYAALAAFNMVIFWATILRHRASRPTPAAPAG